MARSIRFYINVGYPWLPATAARAQRFSAPVHAAATSFVPGRRVDDHVQIQRRYRRRARGMLWASQVACGEENGLRLRVYGSHGALRWAQEQPNELWLTKLGQAAKRLTRGMAGLPPSAGAAKRIPPGHPEGFSEAFARLYRDFAADLRDQQAGYAHPQRRRLQPIYTGKLDQRLFFARYRRGLID